jgi:hypothetical protein
MPLPEKSQSGIGISSGSQLLQSGIDIPASGFSSWTSPALPSYGCWQQQDVSSNRDSSIASNFANLEASKMLFLFEKIKLRMKNLKILTFDSPIIKSEFCFGSDNYVCR